MKKVQPHVILHECVCKFDYQELATVLGPSYEVQSLVFDPTDLGWPTRRRRRYTLCVLVQTSNEEQSSLRSKLAYDSFFGRVAFRKTMVDARVCFQADRAQQERLMNAMALQRHVPLKWVCARRLAWPSLLNIGDFTRLIDRGRRCLGDLHHAGARGQHRRLAAV